MNNTTVFPISPEYHCGEVHRDITIMSFNSHIVPKAHRQFHVEGFTNIYLSDDPLSTDDTAVFRSRETENTPGDWKARLTLSGMYDEEFKQEFDVAMDGQNYTRSVSNEWQRVK